MRVGRNREPEHRRDLATRIARREMRARVTREYGLDARVQANSSLLAGGVVVLVPRLAAVLGVLARHVDFLGRDHLLGRASLDVAAVRPVAFAFPADLLVGAHRAPGPAN